uniref:Odorant receptor n=1 Tax=Aulacocentrum confusum TaxID=2767324 RepID=A0A7G8Z921_9HYME|nr:olfactory receptor 2 [Aulacocentrum confusum]
MRRNQEFDFKIYGPIVFSLLSSVKILKNSKFSSGRKILNTCISGILVTMALLLVVSEMFSFNYVHDMHSFAAVLCPICFHVLGTFKWISSMMRTNDLQGLMNMMKNCHKYCLRIDESDRDNKRYKQKFDKFKKQISLYATIWLSVCACGVIQWCLNPIIYDSYYQFHVGKKINASRRHLPYPGVFPWKITNIWKYIGTFAFQVFSAFPTSISHGIFDILNLSFVASGCIQLEYLHECLTNNESNMLILRDREGIDKYYRKIRNCMIHHQLILEYIERCNIVFSPPMFFACVNNTLALCVVSLETSAVKIQSNIETVVKLLSLTEYGTGITISLFLYCSLAARIETLGLQISDSINSCDWEFFYCNEDEYDNKQYRNVATKISRNIQIGMMRAQKPIIINGGPFYILSLPTFKAMTGFALSNAIVLRQLSDGH